MEFNKCIRRLTGKRARVNCIGCDPEALVDELRRRMGEHCPGYTYRPFWRRLHVLSGTIIIISGLFAPVLLGLFAPASLGAMSDLVRINISGWEFTIFHLAAAGGLLVLLHPKILPYLKPLIARVTGVVAVTRNSGRG